MDVPPLLNVNIALANVARLTGDHDLRVEASRAAVKLCGGLDDRRHLVMAYQGLAHALAEAGRDGETEQAYRDGLAEAEKLKDRKLAANVLRNHAIWLDERGRRADAEALHRRAVEAAEASGDRVMRGRALGAYGIFLHHGGANDRAGPLLEKALELLPASEPDAFYVQNHLGPLRCGEKCTCGQGGEVLSALVQRLVRERAPEGLVESVQVILAEGQPPDVKVQLSRKPTAEELEQLNRVVNQTVAELRQNYRQSGYGR